MFYEYVSEGQAQQWLSALDPSEEVSVSFVFKQPADMESEKGGYDYACEMRVQRWYDDGRYLFEWFNEEGDMFNDGVYDFETAVDLMQGETDAGLGADVELQGIDPVME